MQEEKDHAEKPLTEDQNQWQDLYTVRSNQALSQMSGSPTFVNIFGTKPWKPRPSETYLAFRGRRIDYLQHILHFDYDMKELESPPYYEELADLFKHFELQPIFFSTRFKGEEPANYVTFTNVEGFDIWPINTNRYDSIIVNAQARLIESGYIPRNIYPNPGLEKLAQAVLRQESL